MKIISWNVNGINACTRNGLIPFIKKESADMYCLQEVKVSKEKLNEEIQRISGYKQFWVFAKQKGRSGLAVFAKQNPLQVLEGMGIEKFDDEARVLTLEFENFFLINAYFPHTSRDLSRLNYKLAFNDAFQNFCKSFNKPLIIVGDINVAHTELDLANPKQNKKNAGFTPQEREWFSQFLDQGYIDTFRMFEECNGHYTWWTYRNNARERNIGWRIDYNIVSCSLRSQVKESSILSTVRGSDHCPIRLILN